MNGYDIRTVQEAPRAQEREDHDDLHSRAQSRRPGRPEPGGPLVGLSSGADDAARGQRISHLNPEAYPRLTPRIRRTLIGKQSPDLIHSAGDTGLLPSAWSAYRGRISLSPRPLIRGPKGGSPVACTRWFLKSASRPNPRSAPGLALLRDPAKALTWIRKRRRIETTYRMSDIRWPEPLLRRRRRKVNLEVGRQEIGGT